MLEISYLGSRGIVLCSEIEGADQCVSAPGLFSHMQKSRFSHDEAHLSVFVSTMVIQQKASILKSEYYLFVTYFF